MAVEQDHNAGFAFLQAAVRRPDDLAVFNDSFRMTYGHLADLVVALARGLQLRGVGPGALVAVRSGDVVAVMASLYATAVLGARWSFVTGPEDLRSLPGATLVLDAGEEGAPALPGALRLDGGLLVGPDAGSMAVPFPGYDDPDAPWILSQTSGTTGVPKVVALSYRVMSQRLGVYGLPFSSPGRRITGLFNTGAIALITRYLTALAHGATIMADPDPQAWWRHKVDVVFGSPAQIRQFMGDTVLPGRLPAVYGAGAALPEAMVRHLLRSFERVSGDYGSTECGYVFSICHSLGADGSLLRSFDQRPEITMEMVDAEDRPVPPGEEGVLRLRGAGLADGYLGDPQLTARVFRGGWFYPGDMARRAADGGVEITGRINDQFNIGGTKINAAVLDAAILRVAGVSDAATFLVPSRDGEDRLTALIELEPGAFESDVFAMIRVELMRLGSPNLVPRRLLRTDRIPRTPTGKPDRAACVAAVLGARDARRRDGDAKLQ